jgi:hypothetical protein
MIRISYVPNVNNSNSPVAALGHPPREANLVPWDEVHVNLIGSWSMTVNDQELSFYALTCIDPVSKPSLFNNGITDRPTTINTSIFSFFLKSLEGKSVVSPRSRAERNRAPFESGETDENDAASP